MARSAVGELLVSSTTAGEDDDGITVVVTMDGTDDGA